MCTLPVLNHCPDGRASQTVRRRLSSVSSIRWTYSGFISTEGRTGSGKRAAVPDQRARAAQARAIGG